MRNQVEETHVKLLMEAAPLSNGSANEPLDDPPMLRMVPSGMVTPAEQKTLLLTSRGRKELVAKLYSSA